MMNKKFFVAPRATYPISATEEQGTLENNIELCPFGYRISLWRYRNGIIEQGCIDIVLFICLYGYCHVYCWNINFMSYI